MADIRRLERTDSSHPSVMLPGCDDVPALYIRGSFVPADAGAVAVVGTRNASSYGTAAAGEIVGVLSRRGITVVSGAARGIDRAAHKAALEAGGRTIAVLGHGLNHPVPSLQRELLDKIADSGAVVSQFPDGTGPRPWMFPKRNKTIVALSSCVVVVEAPRGSGALITAELAKKAGKPVYAVPGPMGSPGSKGVNELIRNGARLLDDPEKFADGIQGSGTIAPRSFNLSTESASIMEVLSSIPMEAGEIAAAVGMDMGSLSARLLELELLGMVKRLPGGYYQKRT